MNETTAPLRACDLDIVRGLARTPELRAPTPGSDGLGTLATYFSAFGIWYEVESLWEGKFLERIAPGTFKQTIRVDRPEMRVLFDHGFDPQIGNKVLGPIDVLREEEYGPYGEVPLFDTSYNRDLLPGLREGVYGASFRFRVQEERWNDEPAASDHNPKGIPERTILRAWVGEFGPVTFPANPAATAGMRSLTDHYYDGLRQRDTSAYHAAIRAAGRPAPDLSGVMTIDHAGRPVARSAGGGETPDAQPGNGQASSIRPEVRVIDVHPLQSKEYYRV